MQIVVKPTGQTAEKWARRAASASGEYADGVATTSRSWETATAAAEANYKAGVTEAAGRGAFGSGVKRAGNAKWRENSLKKGPGRFSEGVGVGQQEYASRVGPYLDAIGRVDLPPAGPRGAAQNYQRVQAIGTALRALKVGRK